MARIATECGHCGRPMHLTVDSDCAWRVGEEEARPLIFEPAVDWERFRKPNIIDDY